MPPDASSDIKTRRGAKVETHDAFFLGALTYTLQNEIGSDWANGGFSVDPNDSGGATKWGVTARALEEYRGAEVTEEDVRDLTLEEAREVYLDLFWNHLSLSLVNRPAISTAVFDAAVLFGVYLVVLFCQKSSKSSGFADLVSDGIIGPRTLEALNHVRISRWNIEFRCLLQERISFLIMKYPKNLKYENGWRARVERLKSLV